MANNPVQSLERITVASSGTPVRLTVNEGDPTTHLGVHSILFQRDDPNDTGLIYIGTSAAMNIATLADVIAILAVPSTSSLPAINITLTPASNALDAREFYIDADVSGDSILASFLEA